VTSDMWRLKKHLLIYLLTLLTECNSAWSLDKTNVPWCMLLGCWQ